jgi:hypothetical protein
VDGLQRHLLLLGTYPGQVQVRMAVRTRVVVNSEQVLLAYPLRGMTPCSLEGPSRGMMIFKTRSETCSAVKHVGASGGSSHGTTRYIRP